MNLSRLIRAEFIKQKMSWLWAFLFVIPLGTTAAMLLDMVIRYDDYLYPNALKEGMNSWELLIVENHLVLAWGGFLPVFIAIICSFIHYTEIQSDAWKRVLSYPVSRGSVYLSKFVIVLLFSFGLIALNAFGLILVGKVIGFPEAIPSELFMKYVGSQFMAIVSVAALQSWISSYFKNIIYPILIGFGGMIISGGLQFQAPKIAAYFPYNFATFADGIQQELGNILYVSPIFAVLLLVVGIIEFSRRDIH